MDATEFSHAIKIVVSKYQVTYNPHLLLPLILRKLFLAFSNLIFLADIQKRFKKTCWDNLYPMQFHKQS